MTASFALLPIPLDASGSSSPTRFAVELLATPEFASGPVSPQDIATAIAAHPLFKSGSPLILRALALPYDVWRASPQQLVAGGLGVTPLSLHYSGKANFAALRTNLNSYLARSASVSVAEVKSDHTHDGRGASDFMNVGAAHKRVVQLRRALATEVAAKVGFKAELTSEDLTDRSVAYARRRWVSAQAQASLVHLLLRDASVGAVGLQSTVAMNVPALKREVAALKKRLDPATTAPRRNAVAPLISAASGGVVSPQDPNVAVHAALTEGLIAQNCGLVTSWIANSEGPLVGDYVLSLDPASFPAAPLVVCRPTAMRRKQTTHPLSFADIGKDSTSNGGLALLTEDSGRPRYTCTSVNSEVALVQATVLQPGNSISNDGAVGASGVGQRDDRPPVELASEQFGTNEMEATGLTISAPVEDLVVADPLKSATRQADLPCLFLEDLWMGYRLDIAPEGRPLRSVHRQMRRVTFASGRKLSGETEDFALREPANQMATAVSTEVLRYTGMSAAQAADYARFLGTYRPPPLTPEAPFSASAERGLEVTPLHFGTSYAYRLRNVFQGGVSLRHDDPGLPDGQSPYVQTTHFERGRSFRAGEVIGSVTDDPKNDRKQLSVYLTPAEPKAKLLIAPAPVDPDTARYSGQFLSGNDEPRLDANRAFVTDLPGYLRARGADAPYYCDPDVSEIAVELWMRNGDPKSTDRKFLYRDGAYCEVVDPLHLGPLKAQFGPAGSWRRYRPIELVFRTTSDLEPRLRVKRHGRVVEVLVPLFAEIDVVLTPILSAGRLTRALKTAAEGQTSDWPVVEHRIRVVHCGPRPARAPVIVSESGTSGLHTAFALLLERERLAAPVQLVARIEVDAASTDTLQIEGAWEEIDDTPIHPRYVVLPGRCVSIPRSLTFSDFVAPPPDVTIALNGGGKSFTLSRAVENIGRHCAENMVFLGSAPTLSSSNPKTAACVLPLPDGRRRRISCVATGHGRYAAHFPSASAKTLEARSAAVIGDAPASMLLPTPQLSHILPIVRELKSRNGNRSEARRLYGFRIYVQRPCFLSGVGERIAIGCHAGPSSAGPRATLNKLFTQWGEDPIQRPKLDATRRLPRATDFRYAVGSAPVSLDPTLYPPDSPEGTDPALFFDDIIRDSDALTSEDARLALVSFALRWDDAVKLWYCDVELAKPFAGWLGLALYRHQPHAHEGLQISRSAAWVYSMVIQGEQVSWVRQGDRFRVTIGPVFDKTSSFEAEPGRSGDGVSEPLEDVSGVRVGFDSYTVDGRTYFEGYFDAPSGKLRIVRRRFGFDLSSFSLET